jgi:hypothetical protein
VLTALASANLFRDQSGLAGTQVAAQTASTGTLNAATEAGRIASENFKAATQQATEMGKAAADMWKISKSKNGQGSGGPASAGISGDGARINQGRDLDRRGVTDSPAGSSGSTPRVTAVAPPVFAADGNQPPATTTSRELIYSDEAVAASPALLQQTAAGLSAGTIAASPSLGMVPSIPSVGSVGFFDWLWLLIISNDVAAANVSLQGARLIPMRFHDNYKEFGTKPVFFSAWTNGPQHIYVNIDWFNDFYHANTQAGVSAEESLRNVRAAAAMIVRHESEHVSQFVANSGNPPGTFREMIAFEHQAYVKDVAWLQDPQTVNFMTNTLQVSASFVADLVAAQTDSADFFNGLKTTITGNAAADEALRKKKLTTPRDPSDPDSVMLPATIKGNPNYPISDLYKTVPPP